MTLPTSGNKSLIYPINTSHGTQYMVLTENLASECKEIGFYGEAGVLATEMQKVSLILSDICSFSFSFQLENHSDLTLAKVVFFLYIVRFSFNLYNRFTMEILHCPDSA
jgi:hypothetical protein